MKNYDDFGVLVDGFRPFEALLGDEQPSNRSEVYFEGSTSQIMDSYDEYRRERDDNY